MDKCDEECLSHNIEHLGPAEDQYNTADHQTIDYSASVGLMNSLGINIKPFDISRPWLNKNWRRQKHTKPPEKSGFEVNEQSNSTRTEMHYASSLKSNSKKSKTSCTTGTKRRTIYGGGSLASTFSVFLIKCLIVATAYDDKFVNKLLANRTVVDNGVSLGGQPRGNNHDDSNHPSASATHNPGDNPHGNPHNNSNSGPVTLYDLRYATKNAPELSEHSVRVLLNVENWTAWRLKDALVHNNCGYIMEKYGAKNVEPATREVMIGYKQSGTATGTCGTISWQIEHLDTRLIVMWSVPFNFNIHDSYFAVGMIFNRGRFTSSSYWFNQMYYSEKGPYKRGSGGQTITFENSAVVVVAHMESSTYHPMLNISVIPQVPYKLAPLIWRRLYDNSRALYTGRGSASQVIFGGGTSGRFSLTGVRLPASDRWWTTHCFSYIVDGGILTSILIAALVAAYANILARYHSTSPLKATLPCSPSSNNKHKPNTTSASSTSKLKDNKKCSIGENEISQKQSDNKLQSSKSSQNSGNNSDEWDRPNIAKDFSSEPCPHLLVFNSYKNDTLPISNIFATDFNRDNKSISRTTKATIDDGR